MPNEPGIFSTVDMPDPPTTAKEWDGIAANILHPSMPDPNPSMFVPESVVEMRLRCADLIEAREMEKMNPRETLALFYAICAAKTGTQPS